MQRQTEHAVRVSLARLYATRHGRDVPLEELQRDLAASEVQPTDVEPSLRALEREHLAVRTERGWRPAAPPPRSRTTAALALAARLHP
ncbi:MAG TPA: hypothetical protein VFH78_11815 [Candidatus Thermoplasmatota archaeon]|nr:hypothetical protein [Candidatus Thermoplasmatota archaeon]